mmetsp:Transcript_23698/g.65784  ORF Transcript_23698/g.65784 Transcript_23698/m.65784 type:complete len:596 (+) Transcript_23698:230-2017(+)|eukprot:CAMPEP_0172364810 /NCGR_PEP_ID=MMETSP1060-20121228/7858_1 /TAXON_ID=37318 /ORGANISM="Pseudo-nitzschia pungens, Strain cf. cingulata" /LENGTH=595 /DNA_ID=CAMNT_0013087909 /DNA_START=121 /DNA_END=1908 /DNA_ORIENTATION=+
MFCPNVKFSDASDEVEATPRPMPLKQRTSSSTDRRDFTPSTWISLLELIKLREYLITVNHFSIWRRHNAWAMEDGKDLKKYITQRYASAMVFMSLLLSTEFGVLFNSSDIVKKVRVNLAEAHWDTIGFWAGLFIILSALFTILSLISTFTFSAMISAVDEANSHCILRSSIGQYATELPGRLIVLSIYTFLVSFMSFFFMLLPVGFFSFCLLLGSVGFFVHVVSVFSSFGRIIMHTGAMSKGRIFSSEYEESLVPHSLHSNLLSKAKCNIKNNISIIRQYRKNKQRPIDRYLLEEDLYDHLCGRTDIDQNPTRMNDNGEETTSNRKRADSKVRFADLEVGLAEPTEEKKSDEKPEFSRPTYGSLHIRSLTPLSDVSEGYVLQGRQLSSTRSTITEDLQSTVSNRYFGSSERPPASSVFPIRREDSAASSVFTISNESMEKWLHGDAVRQKNESQSKTDGQSNTELKDGKTNNPPSVLPAVLPTTVSVATHTWSSSDSNGTMEESEKQSVSKDTELTKRPTPMPKPLAYRRAYVSEMSEDERFIFDYGDFGNESAEGEKHPVEKTNADVASNGWGSIAEIEAYSSSTQNERTKLLE